MVDYIVIGISVVIFIFYLMTIFMSIEIKRKLTKEASTAFLYIIFAIFVLVIRRIQQIFLQADIVNSIPYFTDFVTLLFAILFFMAIFHFHKSIKAVSKKSSADPNRSKPLGIKLLLGGLSILILITLLSRLDILKLVNIQPDLLSLITVLFVTTEIGVRSVITGSSAKKTLGKAGWFGTIVTTLLFLALASGWVGLVFPYMEMIKGILEIALLIFVFIEIIR